MSLRVNLGSIFPRKPSLAPFLGILVPCCPLHNLIIVHGTVIISPSATPLPATMTPGCLIYWASQHLASAW